MPMSVCISLHEHLIMPLVSENASLPAEKIAWVLTVADHIHLTQLGSAA